ncbi:TrfB-related DNA-binding protein [Pseudomonas sp. RP23018S]|uniref:TrfB-related DNA-binding protein n=1 Tax=Pseudomonas sp. RP23018S TaxID=3096037 RepID=UPI002ACA0599|nr:TrfB-related DNA-binding protein [Pseudomonas sp. RP23018S]MDZ5605305.1 TrfB-related DNA-binding protein [Pseudomonas sp. RP23018S]
MSKPITMTRDEFESEKHKLIRLSMGTIRLAELILVDGKTPSAAAKEVGSSRQNVSKAMQRVYAALEDVPTGWVHFEGWMPEKVSIKLKIEIERERNKLDESR